MTSLVPNTWRRSVNDLRNNMMRTFDRWRPRHDEDGFPISRRPFWQEGLFETGGPTVDVEENEDEITVTAEMPGLDKDDFKLEVEGERLILRGEKKSEHEKKGRSYYYSERQYGSFYRVIPLPAEIEVDKVKASYKNGVLRAHLPKTEESKARSIHIDVS